VLTAAALGSTCGEEACDLFGELFKELEVRAVVMQSKALHLA
jgi:hypothetical protein